MPDMKVVARRSKSPTKTLPAEVVHCPGCGRVWVRDDDVGFEDCPRCHHELYPTGRKIVVGEELRAGDRTEVRVSREETFQDLHMLLSAIADRIGCDCAPGGVVCLRCRAEQALKEFPTFYEYESGTLEEAWATLRPGRQKLGAKPVAPAASPGARRIPFLDIDMED